MSNQTPVLNLPLRTGSGDSKWFSEARFGMFIHWGLYSLAARHEWVQNREKLDDASYRRYFDRFDPDLYDPGVWADAAAGAGMKYFVVTTKHHDGFCLWDSEFTDFKVTNTPHARDLIAPMIEAFESRGLASGLYHSLIDWHHPDFRIDELHPLRDSPDRVDLNATRDPSAYRRFLRSQVQELLTRFPSARLLFFDFSYVPSLGALNERGGPWEGKGRVDWGSEDLVRMIRQMRPDILINDRLDLLDSADAWDYTTPEQYQPIEWKTAGGERVLWEACQTFSGSWGYHREEETWKSVPQLVRMLVDTVAKGGNLLLNVGPTGRGEFDMRALDRLHGMGEWMRRHGRSIYGCTASSIEPPQDCRYTYNPITGRLYLHCFAWPAGELHLQGLDRRLKYAQLLNDASEITFREGSEHEAREGITLYLPIKPPQVAVPVVELFLKPL